MPVTDTHPDYDKYLPRWKKNRDFSEGADPVKGAGDTYLPKLKGETEENFGARVNRTVYYNASGRTLAALVGAIFRKPPDRQLPDAINVHLDNLDLAGTPCDIFEQELISEQILAGRVGVCQDWSEGMRRPYWVMYRAEQITNWSQRITSDGRVVVDQVSLKETVNSRSAEGFGMGAIAQYRVLELDDAGEYFVRIFQADPETNEWKQTARYTPTRQGVPLTEIPFEIFGPLRLGLPVQKTPISDVVDLNHDHYQLSADHRHILHKLLPILNVFGDDQENRTVKIGGTEVNYFPPEAKMEYCTHGISADSIKAEMAVDEERMALLGARMLSRPKREAETAEALQLLTAGENATLASIALAASVALTRLWRRHVAWMGGDPNGVMETLNRDFVSAPIDPATLTALFQIVQAGKLSVETFLEYLQSEEVYTHDVQIELDRIAMDEARGGATLNLDEGSTGNGDQGAGQGV